MKEIIKTAAAPGAIGPYSQALAGAGLIFTSGQLPIDSATETMPEGIAAQTRQSLLNVRAIVEAAGSSMDQVLKTIVFLSDMNNFSEMNKIYGEFFKEGHFPARSAVEVSCLPKNALIEIEAIALKCDDC